MTDFGFLLLLLGAYLAYRFVIKPRFIESPKTEKKVRIDRKSEQKDYDDDEFIDYEEIKE